MAKAKKKIKQNVFDFLQEHNIEYFIAAPYNYTVILCKFADLKMLGSVFKEAKKIDTNGSWGVTFNDAAEGYKVVVVTLSDVHPFTTIPHELVHVKNMIYAMTGVHSDYYNDEAEAYFFGYISMHTMDALKRMYPEKYGSLKLYD